MSKPIKELVEEAQELGVNLHDYVAKELYGTINMTTRRRAKQLTFGILYGSTATVAKKPGSGGPRTMTEEQIKAQCWVPEDFKQTWMGEPFQPRKEHPPMAMPSVPYLLAMTERQHQQSEDRMHRVGVTPYKVEVLDYITAFPGCSARRTPYTIRATSALSARCMAFVLDGGCQIGLNHWGDEQIELALQYTEIIE